MAERNSRRATAHVGADRLGRAAGRGLDNAIRIGAVNYDRTRDLPKLLRIDPRVGIADTAESAQAIVKRLECALRAERNRARSGHWTYDLNRHIALRQAHCAEMERLAALRAGRR